jgi:membrane protein DedA with SNARE-associated domain/UDP-2,3-diacylglucosamine pyrophosphatase LpxH
MGDLDLTDLLLNSMTTYGPAVLGSALLLGGAGLPVPATLLVLAAGALARQGLIDWSLALVVGLLGVVLGDSLGYALGRFGQAWAQRRLSLSRSATWRRAQDRFEQGGALAIYSTRFLVTPLALPTNLIAGGSGYAYRRFLSYDVAGEMTWLLLYGGLGYAFASQWQTINRLVADLSGWLVGAAVAGIGIYFLASRARPWTWPLPQITLKRWLVWGQERLDQVLETAAEIPFDDTSKIVLLSDVHRGDKSAGDEFAPNEALFTHALRHYYRDGFTYIELGDGDDVWQAGRFGAIREAYPRVFELLRQFRKQNRLHRIMGNHEIQGRGAQKDDLAAEEGLVLRHRRTGQRLFVVHGHQMDVWCDQLAWIGRPAARLIYAVLNLLGFKTGAVSAPSSQAKTYKVSHASKVFMARLSRWYKNQQEKLTQHWVEWARNKRQLVIAGHTHLPRFATDRREPYFNTGCCVNPGYLTGIEIRNGYISLVKWFANGAQRYERSLLGAACKLSLFA